MKPTLAALVAVSLAGASVAASASVVPSLPIYRETFSSIQQNNPDRFRGAETSSLNGGVGATEMFDTGWIMGAPLRDASSNPDLIQFYPGGNIPANEGDIRSNSSGLAPDAPETHIFWSPKDIDHVATYTEEFSWNWDQVTAISADFGRRPENAPVEWRAMIKLDGVWYASEDYVTSIVNSPLGFAGWNTVLFDPRAILWREIEVSFTPAPNPFVSQDLVVTDPLGRDIDETFLWADQATVSLPDADTFEGFGFLADDVFANQYIDNPTVYGIPEPSVLGLFGLGGLALFIAARRRR